MTFNSRQGADGMKILIVDDSKYQRYLIDLALAKYGKCDQVADGEEAVASYRAALEQGAPYDLVLMDILMPNMDGHEAVRRIGALQQTAALPDEKRSKIVMLSSLDDPVNMMQAQFEDGAHAYLTKPFDEVVLVETLASLGLIDAPLDIDDTL
jgi:two-component system chemotaxis response regulator CheY